MPAVSLTRQYATLLSLTFDQYKPTLVDNIHRGIPYLWWLENRAKGVGVRMESGGTMVRVPVIYATNTNARSYYGYDPLVANATEEITSTFERWRSNATVVAISLDEILENGGVEGIIKILPSKMAVGEMSMRQEINRQLVQGTVEAGATPLRFIDGNSNKDLLPLGNLIQKEFATASITVHNVNQNTNSWWQNQATDFDGATTGTLLKKTMTTLYNNCSKGGTNDSPDLILSDQSFYEAYMATLTAQQRFGNYEDVDVAGAGFPNLRFMGATMIWDEYVPSMGTTTADAVSTTQAAANAVAFFINTNWVEFVVHRDAYFEVTPWVEPNDQTAIYAKILLKATHIVTQRRKQGLAYDFDTTSGAFTPGS